MNTIVYISNITSDEVLESPLYPHIDSMGFHKLLCDRQYEGNKKEKQVVSILNSSEYNQVKTKGFYTVLD